MKIVPTDSYDSLSRLAKDHIMSALRKNKSMLLCTATGGSPTGTYQRLGEDYLRNPDLFFDLRIVKLDEWGGIPLDNQATCESYLQQYLIKPLKISEQRYMAFNSDPPNPGGECERIDNLLQKNGPIDLCILGIGRNGHIGFNEPADFLQPNCHVASLSPLSQQHQMASELNKKPTFGLTLGMANILKSRKILLLVSGSEKKEIVNKLLSKKITTNVPASFLWLHPDTTCIIQSDLLN